MSLSSPEPALHHTVVGRVAEKGLFSAPTEGPRQTGNPPLWPLLLSSSVYFPCSIYLKENRTNQTHYGLFWLHFLHYVAWNTNSVWLCFLVAISILSLFFVQVI